MYIREEPNFHSGSDHLMLIRSSFVCLFCFVFGFVPFVDRPPPPPAPPPSSSPISQHPDRVLSIPEYTERSPHSKSILFFLGFFFFWFRPDLGRLGDSRDSRDSHFWNTIERMMPRISKGFPAPRLKKFDASQCGSDSRDAGNPKHQYSCATSCALPIVWP